jgi:FAD binding domain
VMGAIPLPGEGRWRLVNVNPKDDKLEGTHLVDHFRELLHANGKPRATLTDATWASSFHVQRRITDRFRVGRCFVAGDAAHIHSPAGGQGLNTGIQDAANLAWKLGLVVAGAAPETILDSYEAERRPVARGVLRGTDLLTRAIALRHPVAVSIRNAVVSFLAHFDFVQRRIAHTMSELDINYRRSPLVADDHGSGPRPGDRAPDVPCGAPDGRVQRLFEVLRDTRHTLLLFVDNSMPTETSGAIQAVGDLLSERYRRWINAHLVQRADVPLPNIRWNGARLLDRSGHLYRRFGASSSCLYLIRPDGYVGYRSQPPDAKKLAAYLGRVFV